MEQKWLSAADETTTGINRRATLVGRRATRELDSTTRSAVPATRHAPRTAPDRLDHSWEAVVERPATGRKTAGRRELTARPGGGDTVGRERSRLAVASALRRDGYDTQAIASVTTRLRGAPPSKGLSGNHGFVSCRADKASLGGACGRLNSATSARTAGNGGLRANYLTTGPRLPCQILAGTSLRPCRRRPRRGSKSKWAQSARLSRRA